MIELRTLNLGGDVQNKDGRLFRLIASTSLPLSVRQNQFDDDDSKVGDEINVPLVQEGMENLGNAQFRRIA